MTANRLMIKDNLYNIKEIQWDGEKFIAVIELIPESEVYKGHFPCHPITPGVCLVQIAVDTICTIEKKNLYLKEAKNIKFLSIVSPLEQQTLRYELVKVDDSGKWVVCAFAGDTMCSKMSILLCNVL